MQNYQLRFIDLALSRDALRFGNFKLKSGRDSPTSSTPGCSAMAQAAAVLGQCYAAALLASGIEFDVLFGPAYKGIPLVATTAVALAEHHGRNVPFAFNRKESKDHGEGGNIVGAPLRGRVVIVDDVITAGTAIRESLDIIRGAGAEPVAVALALDRQERGQGTRSAVQELEAETWPQVCERDHTRCAHRSAVVGRRRLVAHFCGSAHSPSGPIETDTASRKACRPNRGPSE